MLFRSLSGRLGRRPLGNTKAGALAPRWRTLVAPSDAVDETVVSLHPRQCTEKLHKHPATFVTITTGLRIHCHGREKALHDRQNPNVHAAISQLLRCNWPVAVRLNIGNNPVAVGGKVADDNITNIRYLGNRRAFGAFGTRRRGYIRNTALMP